MKPNEDLMTEFFETRRYDVPAVVWVSNDDGDDDEAVDEGLPAPGVFFLPPDFADDNDEGEE